jgi:hypothetical protein
VVGKSDDLDLSLSDRLTESIECLDPRGRFVARKKCDERSDRQLRRAPDDTVVLVVLRVSHDASDGISDCAPDHLPGSLIAHFGYRPPRGTWRAERHLSLRERHVMPKLVTVTLCRQMPLP